MLFDLLAAVVDAHLPSARPFLHDARLFDFPYRPHEVLPKEFPDAERRAFFAEHFFLPFHAVAVEDKASVVVLVDAEQDQKGLMGRRYFVEGLPLHDADPLAWRPEEQALIRDRLGRDSGMPPDSLVVTAGVLDGMEMAADNKFHVQGEVGTCLLATPNAVVMSFDREFRRTREYLGSTDVAMHLRGETRAAEEEAMRAATLRNVAVAMEEVMLFNTPERFIVEDVSPEAFRAGERAQARKQRERDPMAKRILRSAERPIYVLATPDEIRERFHFPTPTGGVKRAHERRRHLRTYPDDPARWPTAHGRTVVIPASWVGPSEIKVNKRRYRVMLDL